MGIMSVTVLFLALVAMLVLKEQVRLSLVLMLVIIAVLTNEYFGFERSIVAVLPLALILISFLVSDKKAAKNDNKNVSWSKAICVAVGVLIILYIQKIILEIFEFGIKDFKQVDVDLSLFYFLPFVIVIGSVVINEVGHGPDYNE